MPTTTNTIEPSRRTPPYRLRRSRIHGSGVFATRPIRKGTRIIEYLGERVSHAEADRRHARKAADDAHTFLFTIDSRTVIDAGVDGNDARFINHSCDPNCEAIIDDGRIFIEAIRRIEPGEELAYDYCISRDADDPEDVEQVFACRCGAASCRGTMLAPPPKKTAPRAPKRAASGGKAAAPRARKPVRAKRR